MNYADFVRLGRMPALDGLRALSVLLVLISHYLDVPGGRLGVDAFFALSGFLITWLLVKEWQESASISLTNFFSRRVMRIFPAYYVYLMVIFAVETLQGTPGLEHLVAPTVFYYYNYFAAVSPNTIGEVQHLWSLSVEEQFYLLWPIVFVFLLNRGLRFAIYATGAAITLICLWRSLAWLLLDIDATYLYRASDTRFDSILVGCLLALVLSQPQWGRTLWNFAHKTRGLIAALVGLALSVYLTEISADYGYTAGFTIDGLLLSYILMHAVKHHTHATVRWLDAPFFVFIGTISYPIYLYHELAEGTSRRITDWVVPLVGAGSESLLWSLMHFGLASVGAVVAGYLSYRFVERPALRHRRRLAEALTQLQTRTARG